MKTGELLISVVILVGSLFVTAVTLIAESIRTGVPSLDRFEIRYRIAFWAFRRFGPRAATDLRIPRALMAIVNNESGGVADIKHYLGDKTAKGGPSIGPMQVYRQTAKDLGLWRPPPGATAAEERAAYEALALDEAEIPLQGKIVPEILGGQHEIVGAARHQQGDLHPPARQRGSGVHGLLPASLPVRARPH